MAMTVASNFRGWLRKISCAVIFCVASIATYPGSEPVGYRSPKLSINAAATSAIIETNALPLRVHSDPIYTRSIMAIGAGAIAVIQGKVVILDRVGRLFLYDREMFMKILAFDCL